MVTSSGSDGGGGGLMSKGLDDRLKVVMDILIIRVGT